MSREYTYNYDYADDDYGYYGNYGYSNGLHSGDPHQDIEYEKAFDMNRIGSLGGIPAPGAGFNVPDDVVNFLLHLYRAISEHNVFEIHTLYEKSFNTLTEAYYEEKPWPEEREVLQIVGNREHAKTFIIFYKELYYRHIYAKCLPTIEQRLESYGNYCALFNYLLNAPEPVSIELPNQWLWDIIDEFIYQFQSYSLHRMKANAGKLSEYEVEQMKRNPHVWNVHSVLNVLHSLVDKSKINDQLREFNAGRNPDVVADEFGRQSIYKMLGYFALVGLLRLHSLLGDYYQAIKVLENIDVHRQPLESASVPRVLACQMTTFYYVGFAYLMMRRYADAIRTFVRILSYLQRTRQIFHQYKTFQMNLIDKQTDQMYVLLNICLVLHPQRIDESISSVLDEKYGDSKLKMQRAEISEFESAFRYACPKFLSPVPSISEHDETPVKVEPWQQQLKVFMDEIHQQLPILVIRSYLKLYTTMPISKLAGFLEIDENMLRVQLLAYKHKMRNIVWNESIGNSGLDGDFESGSDVDFFINEGMVHVADTKVARKYGDFFLRQIHKFEELYEIAAALPRAPPVRT